MGLSLWGDILNTGGGALVPPTVTLQKRVLTGPVLTIYRSQTSMADDTHYIYSQALDDSTNPEGLVLAPGDALELAIDTISAAGDSFRMLAAIAWVKVPLVASIV